MSKRDWSSDVCSSDLNWRLGQWAGQRLKSSHRHGGCRFRSEERRVGKECRSGGLLYHEKKKTDERDAQARWWRLRGHMMGARHQCVARESKDDVFVGA